MCYTGLCPQWLLHWVVPPSMLNSNWSVQECGNAHSEPKVGLGGLIQKDSGDIGMMNEESGWVMGGKLEGKGLLRHIVVASQLVLTQLGLDMSFSFPDSDDDRIIDWNVGVAIVL